MLMMRFQQMSCNERPEQAVRVHVRRLGQKASCSRRRTRRRRGRRAERGGIRRSRPRLRQPCMNQGTSVWLTLSPVRGRSSEWQVHNRQCGAGMVGLETD